MSSLTCEHLEDAAVSIVTSDGYSIDDNQITAFSVFNSANCQVRYARILDNPDDRKSWCARE